MLQNSFCLIDHNFSRAVGARSNIDVGTTSFCDELTDDFGGAFEVTSIGGCRLFCRLPEI